MSISGRFRCFLTLALLIALRPVAGLAADGAATLARFRPVPDIAALKLPVSPLFLDGSRIEVMVKLTGASVAEERAKTPGRGLTAARRQEVEGALQSEHARAERNVSDAGGVVLRHMYHAWNGMRVAISRGRVTDLTGLPGVTAVYPVRVHHLDNAVGVPFIGAPLAWAGVPALTGRHVKVGIIDTGIDYTHANFGGPGTPAAFAAAAAASDQPADPALFGPSAAKVKGGTDLVGDDYDADYSDEAHAATPDPNPLDCNGHGSHVAGTVAGFGVTQTGATYNGPYDSSTYNTAFRIGPGVAPQADLYAIRVFGCEGTTSVVTEAIDWAVENDLDVINMSLGSPFGDEESADSQAADAAAAAGVVVVASAGNSGPSPYLVGSPGVANGALATAAVDAHLVYPAAVLTPLAGSPVGAINANGGKFSDGTTYPVVVLYSTPGDPSSGVSLGCNPSEYDPATGGTDVHGKIVVTQRGVCARVFRAGAAQHFGAAAALMINNAPGLPPYEGTIPGGAPDASSGNTYEPVTIPFFGVSSADGAAITAAASLSAVNASIPNPAGGAVATFSSGGPRFYDSAMKPDVAAPGVTVFSTGIGTGNDGATYNGTSMASPHVAGVAALTIQAHRAWSTDALRASIVNTADPAKLATTNPRLVGAGLVQPALSTKTQVVAYALKGMFGQRRAALDFGYVQFQSDYRAALGLVVKNLGRTATSFDLGTTAAPDAIPHTALLSQRSVRVPAGQERVVWVFLNIPAATAGDSTDLRDASGFVTLAPSSATDNGGVSLRVPYYAVAGARARVSSSFTGPLDLRHRSAMLRVKNPSPLVPGTADFYEWGLWSRNDGLGAVDLEAAGVQSWPVTSGAFAGEQLLVFAIATHGRWSNAAAHEFDVFVDTNGDGTPDYEVVSIDYGLVTSGSANGLLASVVVNLATNDAELMPYYGWAPNDSNTLLVPAFASLLGVSPASPRFSYTVGSLDGLNGNSDAFAGWATFNAFTPALSQADFLVLPPGGSANVPYTINLPEVAQSHPKGLMVVKQENVTPYDQVDLIRLPFGR
ncbi:MAG TPA: S8 family serine peptidase [Anaeromyxobacter sp.]|nr:S8 family serine peptidase [Anaeromyxobacter sp.]